MATAGRPRKKTAKEDNTKPLMVRMPDDLYAQLDAYCLEEGRTKKWVVEKAVAAYLKKK